MDLKSKSRKVTNQYITGDIYDFHSPMESKEDTYVDHEGNGYIMDKTGREYPVSASISQDDAGRIAGGATNYYVTIYFPGVIGPNGKEAYYSVDGYRAVFSNPHNTRIISDLQDGYYLEDYIAKYGKGYNSNIPQELYDELVSRADAEATSYKAQKIASAEKRNAKKDAEMNDKYDFTAFSGTYPKFSLKIENGKLVGTHKEIQQSIIENLQELVNITCGRPLEDFEGLRVYITFDSKKYGLDKETGKIVALSSKENKYGGKTWTVVEPHIYEVLRVGINDTPYGKAVCKYFKTHEREFEDQKLVKTYWTGYSDKPIFASEKGNYKILEEKDGYSYTADTYVRYEVLEKVCKLFPQSVSELKGLNRRAADFNVDRGFKGMVNASEAETKMTAWHNGERKQNVKACSDAKLKAYYKVCKKLGFEKEAGLLKAEADNRGILLESRRVR